MGNTTATATAISSIVNNTVTNVMTQNTSNCSQVNSAIQNLEVSNIKATGNCGISISNITQINTQAPNFSCTNTQNSSAALSAALNAALTQAANTSANGGLGNTSADSTTVSNITNEITNNISMSNVASCAQSTFANQNLLTTAIEGSCPASCNEECFSLADDTARQECQTFQASNACKIDIDGLNQTLTQTVVGYCLNNQSNLAAVISSIADNVSQTTSAASTGGAIDFGASLASCGSWIWIIVAIVVVSVLSCSSISSSLLLPMGGH